MLSTNTRWGHFMTFTFALGMTGSTGCVAGVDDEGVMFDEGAPFDEAEFEGDITFQNQQDDLLSTTSSGLKMVTWNVKDDNSDNYERFRSDYVDSETQIIALQEVNDLNAARSVFSDFPYRYVTQNYSDKSWDFGCFCRRRKTNHIVILSKLPIVAQDESRIQTDPGGDHWRRHAQYVRVRVNANDNIHLFHYHNTFNWHENSSQFEKSGMQSFKNWVESKLGASLSSRPDNVFMLGDFNLGYSNTQNILGSGLHYSFNDFVDYIVSTSHSVSDDGIYPAVSDGLSDHDAGWSRYDSLMSNVGHANANVVRLYEHTQFQGAVVAFEVGNYPSINDARSDWWNDRISSLRWGSRLRVEAWEHHNYSGTKWCGPNSGSCTFVNFNDKISSLKVRAR